jgi:hypothetical protein
MHAAKLLHDLLDNACHSVDKRLRKTLFLASETLIESKKLSIVGLGRSLNQVAKVKHNIKRVDRLFGNGNLHEQRKVFYQGMNHLLLKNNNRPIIIIDWSGLTRCGAYHFLRAAISVNGRSITLYDQAFPLRDYIKEKTHREFLNILQNMLPKNCKPIIISDAGFQNTWFQAVTALGWDFVGRIRNSTHYCEAGQTLWKPIKTLYEKATQKASYVGHVKLAQSRPIDCDFYLVRQKKKYRIKRNLVGKKVQCSASKKHEKRENEPWLIATSLSNADVSAADVISLYKKRMQIEEAFRDLKNSRNGFSLRQCRSFHVERLNVALLIATLAMLVLWLFGIAAKQRNLHYSFQSNTEKRTNVLSNVFIGWQVLKRNEFRFHRNELITALDSIISLTIWRSAC